MGNLAEDHERNIRNIENSALVRTVRVKAKKELLKVGTNSIRDYICAEGHPGCFVLPSMSGLCGEVVQIDINGFEQTTGEGWLLYPWMYEELEVPDPRADERLQQNEEHLRKMVEPRLGPCLSCGVIKLLDMEGAMGECKDCICSRKSFETDVTKVLENIKEILLEKNRKYGDSALNPNRIFAKSDAVEQINVRIDDKLKRIQNRQDDEDEDVTTDLMGYLVLLKIAKGGEV